MSIDKAIALASDRGAAWRQLLDQPPDAGATMLGAYGLGNPVITWLLGRYPYLLELTPKQISDGLYQPKCGASIEGGTCKRWMTLLVKADRGGEALYWHCVGHPARDRIVHLPKAKALKGSPRVKLQQLVALTAEGKTLDWKPDYYGEFSLTAT